MKSTLISTFASREFFSLLAVLAISGNVGAATTTYDFNGGDDGGFLVNTPLVTDGPFVYTVSSGVGGSGGWSTSGQPAENGHTNTTMITSPVMSVLAAGTVGLSFAHIHSFESGGGFWDGGAVYMSVNGGAFNQVGSASFTSNGYNGQVAFWGAAPGTPGSQSDLAGLDAFVGDSIGFPSFMTSTANLGPFAAGDTFSIRFLSSADTNTSGVALPQWAIDNVSLTNTVPEPAVAGLLGIVALGIARRRR